MAEKKEFKGNENSGRKANQAMKPYLVYKFLLKYSDENYIKKIEEIKDELVEEYGISTSARSIRSDINTINQALLIADGKAANVTEAQQMCLREKNCAIVYDEHRRGFYVQKQRNKMNDLYTIANCIYAAPFLDEDTASRLVEMVCDEFVSEDEKEEIKKSLYVPNRTVSDCTSLLKKLETIRFVLKRTVDGEEHIHESITFDYMEYQIQDVTSRTERSQKQAYTVTPWSVFLYEGKLYLLGRNWATRKEEPFRIDRMENIKLIPSERIYHSKHTLGDYGEYYDRLTKYRLSPMGFTRYKGRVTIQFEESLLETVVERFGVLDVVYAKSNDSLFTATVPVPYDNHQFFGWICGLEGNIKIIDPPELIDEYKTHLRRKIRAMS